MRAVIERNPIAVNTRISNFSTTGVQRYLQEILARATDAPVTRISPRRNLAGFKGHSWEQFVLPRLSRGSLLWSPSNTGPIAVERQVVTLHDVVPLDHPEWLTRKFAAWYGFLTPRLARRARHVITVSEFSRTRILHHAGLDQGRISVIYNGVAERFRPALPEHILAVRAKYGITQERYALCLSTLEPRKNLPRVLRAWERLDAPSRRDVELVVAGGQGRSTIFQDAGLLHAPPGVKLAGRIDDADLPALYSGATAFLYPALYEGFGLPPLEAMACGTPVLTSNVTSMPEVVGDAGVLVNPTEVDDIVAGLRQLLTDDGLRRHLSKLGLDRSKKFSWDKTAKRTWDVLKAAAES